jgi:hypothetical protein
LSARSAPCNGWRTLRWRHRQGYFSPDFRPEFRPEGQRVCEVGGASAVERIHSNTRKSFPEAEFAGIPMEVNKEGAGVMARP